MTIWHGPSVSWPRDATLPALLRTAAEAAPDAAALIEAETGRTLTYRDLLELVNSMRAGLAARGLAPGGRLAAVARNSVDFVALALAAQDLGAAVSGLNPATPPEELVRAFAHIGAATMVADAPALEGARAAADRLGIGAVAGFDDIRADGGSGPAETDPEAAAFLPFSSGTSGLPKPVIASHRGLVAGAASGGHVLGIDADSRVILTPPLFHIVGPLMLTLALLKRSPLIIPGSPEPAALFAALARYRVTHLPAVPPLVRALAHHPAGTGRMLPDLRLVISSGAPLAAELQQAASERLGIPVIQALGLTEAVAAITFDDPTSPTPGSVGRAAANFALKVVDPVTGAELGAGEPGELLSRGPARCQGYDHLPEATAELLADDGWLRTGDLVEIDETGLVRVKGRIKDLIKVHAGQVSPVEIESLLLEHPAIADAAVFGRPNAHAGEIPVAYVVWRQDIDPFAVMEWVNDRLLPYKRLRAIETTKAIPRNPQGKTLRRMLAAEDARHHNSSAA